MSGLENLNISMGQEKIINSRQFGAVKIDMDKIVTFPDGIFGFEEFHEFALIHFEEYEPFQWLIALNDPDVIFPIISPILVEKSYAPPIAKESISRIGEFADEDLLLYAIVTIRPKGEEVTANLKGPIVINQKTRIGQQVVLESDEYSLRQSVF